jgi:phosphate acetyltransferase
LDKALSLPDAAIKHIVSPVAGRAYMLVVSNVEAGNIGEKSVLPSFQAPRLRA